MERGAVAAAVRRGLLHRLHWGVYAVGHSRVSYQGRLWAAVLATDGVLSHRAAATVWDLLPVPAGPIDVITTREARSVKGIRVHRSRTLDPINDVVRDEDGLPKTSVARTLVDLADVLDERRLKRVLERAEILRIADVRPLPGRRRLPVVHEPPMTRSELEQRFLALVARHKLPRPEVNATVGGFEVDFHWPRARLVVETDGRDTHLTAAAFEADRRRDAELLTVGWRVVRFTWRQVRTEPGYVGRTLARLL